jgi:hypothetical protein
MNASRPQYDPTGLPTHLHQAAIEMSKRKWLWQAPDGALFFVNDERRARASAAKQGGTVYPPEAE